MSVGKAVSKYVTRKAILEVTEEKAYSPNEDAQAPWFIKSILKLRTRSNRKEMGQVNTQCRVQTGWKCHTS